MQHWSTRPRLKFCPAADFHATPLSTALTAPAWASCCPTSRAMCPKAFFVAGRALGSWHPLYLYCWRMACTWSLPQSLARKHTLKWECKWFSKLNGGAILIHSLSINVYSKNYLYFLRYQDFLWNLILIYNDLVSY